VLAGHVELDGVPGILLGVPLVVKESEAALDPARRADLVWQIAGQAERADLRYGLCI